MAALQNAVRRGQWLLLLNCHLVPNLPALVWCYLDQSNPHPHFRLWITTDRTATLPPILLHNALKGEVGILCKSCCKKENFNYMQGKFTA